MGSPTDDDEPEMEVAPLATPIVRRPRVANPLVDEVITSGEIKPRSLIIRSTAPSMPIEPMPPERAVATPPVRRRHLGWLWLVAAILPAAAVVGLTLARPNLVPVPVPTTDLEAVAELIGTTCDGDLRGAQVHAEAIASSSMLRAGIETDAQTLDDMSRDKDVVFPLGRGESLEIDQLRDGARTPLLRLPRAATPSSAPPPPQGTARLELRGQTPTIVVDAPVPTQSGKIGGEVVLSVPLDLSRVKTHLPSRASAYALLGLGPAIPLDATRTEAVGDRVTFPIHTAVTTAAPLALTAVIGAPPTPGLPMWFRAGRGIGAGLVALFIILFLLSLLLRRSNV